MEVGKRIIELRTRRGLTTNKLANQCGLSQSFVRSVELGEKRITVDNLALICDALHISLRDFFDVPDPDVRISDREMLISEVERLSSLQQKTLLSFLKSM